MKRIAVAFAVLATAPLYAQFPRAVVDPSAADSGAKVYNQYCSKCHGSDARGLADAPDLLRSPVVLHDRREMLQGKELGPYLKAKPLHNFDLSDDQLKDLSQFLTQSINKILRSGYDSRPRDLLSGDAKAGEAYFNGAGGCTKCHSTTGDLAGIGTRDTPATLQQRLLFPEAVLLPKRRIQVTVTTPHGETYTGDLVRSDNFTVALRDKSGEFHSFNRVAGYTIKTDDPYEGHHALLSKYTDADIHNLTTYLDTLK